MSEDRTDHAPWPMRAVILLIAGALCGLAFDRLTGGDPTNWGHGASIGRYSLAIFIVSAGLLAAFTLERTRWTWSLGFALAGGAVLGLIYYWNGSPGRYSADDGWRALASLLAVAIAAPLFQTVRDEGRWHMPYVSVHAHSWSNVVLWFAGWGFVLICFLLAQLLAELFSLIGIDLLRDLLRKSWFTWMLIGGALGAVVGMLRDRDRVVGLLQRVVTTILSMLAPILAAGLVLFVLSLPFTGLGKLWDETRATTPILLACVIGAVILANAVIGKSSEEEAINTVLRFSAMALGAVMAPLVAVAALSTAARIQQYGLTPSRLWAIVFIAIAGCYALLSLYALVRGRLQWADRIRPANIRVAIFVCVVALLLATPLAQFGAISTRSQVARLTSGQVTPEQFDWRALRFSFGPSGVAALQRLRVSGTRPEIRQLASTALAARDFWDMSDQPETQERPPAILVDPAGTPVPPALLAAMRDDEGDYLRSGCGRSGDCRLYFRPGQHAVIVLMDTCALLRRHAYADPASRRNCMFDPTVYVEEGGRWHRADQYPQSHEVRMTPQQERESLRREGDAILRGEVEVRTVERRQLFIAGRPINEPFD